MKSRKPVIWERSKGRVYEMGPMRAVFKADGEETASGYSISEWWLEPHTAGPGAHSHSEDDVFFVLEGTFAILVGETWHEARPGSFLLVPGGTVHDFENRSDERAGLLNFTSGEFEKDMPSIVAWFEKNPLGPA